MEPVTEPVTGPVTEPVMVPVTEPVMVPATGPVTEPATEPATETATEPVTEPVTEFFQEGDLPLHGGTGAGTSVEAEVGLWSCSPNTHSLVLRVSFTFPKLHFRRSAWWIASCNVGLKLMILPGFNI